MTTTDYSDELTNVDRERLSEAAGHLDHFGSAATPPSVKRYSFYRRKGYDRSESLRFALAFLRNSNEQYDRWLSHETGAEGWRAIS